MGFKKYMFIHAFCFKTNKHTNKMQIQMDVLSQMQIPMQMQQEYDLGRHLFELYMGFTMQADVPILQRINSHFSKFSFRLWTLTCMVLLFVFLNVFLWLFQCFEIEKNMAW